MGLLDELATDPQFQLGLGLLAAGGPGQGSTGQRIAGALQGWQARQQANQMNKLRTGLLESQVAENASQAKMRDAQIAQMTRRANALEAAFRGGGGASAPSGMAVGVTPGVGGPGATASGGFSIASMTPEQLALAKEGGVDLTDIYKLTQPNWQNVNGNLVNTNAPGFQGGLQDGMFAGPDGRVVIARQKGNNMVVGAAPGSLDTYGAFEDRKNRSNASFTPGRPTILPGGRMGGQSQLQEVGLEPAPGVAPAGYTTEPQMRTTAQGDMGGTAEQYKKDIADIQASLKQPLDAGSRRLLQDQLQQRQQQLAQYFPTQQAAPAQPPVQSAVAGGGVEFSPSEKAGQDARKAFEVKTAEGDSAQLGAWRSAAEAGNNMVNTAQNLRAAINRGVYAGGGAQAKTAVASMINGFTGVQLKNLPGTELFNAEASKLVLDAIKGLGQNPSNADRDFIEKTMPNILHSAEARDAMIGFLEKKGRGAVDLYQRADAYARKNNGLGGFNQFEQPKTERRAVKTGTYGGRKVIQYDDGTVDYAN